MRKPQSQQQKDLHMTPSMDDILEVSPVNTFEEPSPAVSRAALLNDHAFSSSSSDDDDDDDDEEEEEEEDDEEEDEGDEERSEDEGEETDDPSSEEEEDFEDDWKSVSDGLSDHEHVSIQHHLPMVGDVSQQPSHALHVLAEAMSEMVKEYSSEENTGNSSPYS